MAAFQGPGVHKTTLQPGLYLIQNEYHKSYLGMDGPTLISMTDISHFYDSLSYTVRLK